MKRHPLCQLYMDVTRDYLLPEHRAAESVQQAQRNHYFLARLKPPIEDIEAFELSLLRLQANGGRHPT